MVRDDEKPSLGARQLGRAQTMHPLYVFGLFRSIRPLCQLFCVGGENVKGEIIMQYRGYLWLT
jgi:hypothetical protein